MHKSFAKNRKIFEQVIIQRVALLKFPFSMQIAKKGILSSSGSMSFTVVIELLDFFVSNQQNFGEVWGQFKFETKR